MGALVAWLHLDCEKDPQLRKLKYAKEFLPFEDRAAHRKRVFEFDQDLHPLFALERPMFAWEISNGYIEPRDLC